MLTLKKTGKKDTYQITGTVHGQRIRQSTGTSSYEHAEKQRLDLELELLDRHTWGETKTTVFAEAAVLYMTNGGERRFMNPLLDEFGTMRMAEITDMMVSDFCTRRYPGCGPAGLNRQVYTPLIAVFRRAAKAKICALPHFQRPVKKRRKTIKYAKDDYLAQYLPECSVRLYAASMLLSFTGARAAECCRLEDADVDWDARTAILHETKNGDPRVVVLAPLVYEAMIPLRGRRGPLFGFKTRFSLNQAIERAIDRVNRKGGAIHFDYVKRPDGKKDRVRVVDGPLILDYLTSHQIGRHAFAARFLKQGGTLKELQEAGGWKSFKIVAETYGHLEKSSVHNAVRNSDKELSKLIRKPENVVQIQEVRELKSTMSR